MKIFNHRKDCVIFDVVVSIAVVDYDGVVDARNRFLKPSIKKPILLFQFYYDLKLKIQFEIRNYNNIKFKIS